MPSPPLMLLCAAGVGLAALLYYYFTAREAEAEAYAHDSVPQPRQRDRGRHRGRNGSTRYDIEGCSICQEIVYNPSTMRLLPCGHSFHHRCIEKWVEASPCPPTCPNCRQPLR